MANSGLIAVHVRDGEICVPDSLRCLSTYVLLEQEDWFEKEIGFVRRALLPGENAIDVGANYGAYTIAMARAVGPNGVVWAFEPAAATLGYLRRTIADNRLGNVRLRPLALSDRSGSARLATGKSAELFRLTDSQGPSSEAVEVSTLDREQDAFSGGGISFIKLDAEGAEAKIIAGGAKFFAAQSPLVMLEIMDQVKHDFDRFSALIEQGYALYRLIGPASVLIPFHVSEALDPFELNLFACRPDRAVKLAGRRLLVETLPKLGEAAVDSGLADWRTQPFAGGFGAMAPGDLNYSRVLDAYALWRDPAIPLPSRCAALIESMVLAKAAADERPSEARKTMLARIATECGERQLALNTLHAILLGIADRPPLLDEPFWPASSRYDALASDDRPEHWFMAGLIEAYETLQAHSGYFASIAEAPMLDWLQSSSYANPAMERRRQLGNIRAGRQPCFTATPTFAAGLAQRLNAALWPQGSAA